jgi:hypothetical protein
MASTSISFPVSMGLQEFLAAQDAHALFLTAFTNAVPPYPSRVTVPSSVTEFMSSIFKISFIAGV